MMNYIIYDLEFNQYDTNSTEEINKDLCKELPFEIIQIGAIKVNEYFKIVGTFNKLIKPTLYTSLHPYVKNLTKIDMEEVNNSKTFPEIFYEFVDFIGDDNPILSIWGLADIRELYKNISFHNIPKELIPLDYIDIQEITSKHLKAPGGSRIGLKNAVEIFNLHIEEDFHNAFSDAKYTLEVFKKIYNPNIKSSIYSPNIIKSNKQSKEFIDLEGLFNQISKTFNKTLSSEEKEMVKISYMMGKTRQFIKTKD